MIIVFMSTFHKVSRNFPRLGGQQPIRSAELRAVDLEASAILRKSGSTRLQITVQGKEIGTEWYMTKTNSGTSIKEMMNIHQKEENGERGVEVVALVVIEETTILETVEVTVMTSDQGAVEVGKDMVDRTEIGEIIGIEDTDDIVILVFLSQIASLIQQAQGFLENEKYYAGYNHITLHSA